MDTEKYASLVGKNKVLSLTNEEKARFWRVVVAGGKHIAKNAQHIGRYG